jgi:hypothetical protein
MKMFVALISGALLSSAAIAQHEHGASTGGGSESASPSSERATSTPAAPASTANAEESGERVVCRRFDNTSSRLRRERVCKTAAQWRAYDRNN